LNEWGLPFTFTSTEFVFDGSRGRYRETDPVNPINLYGRQKLEIERHLKDVGGRWTVMRLGKVFASNGSNAKLFTGWIDAIEDGVMIRIANDQIFSPIHVDDVIDGCLLAAEQQVEGLFHLCGARPYGRYELFEMLVAAIRIFRDVDPNVEICSLDDFDLMEPRPKDCSMLPDKLVDATSLRITPIKEICCEIVSDYYDTAGGVQRPGKHS
jgi:dTDP-4-dehydrorhamnose reductase